MIKTAIIDTPIGEMTAGATDNGICLLEFTEGTIPSRGLKELTGLPGTGAENGDNNHLKELGIQLAEYFEGKRKEFTVPLDICGTEFQRLVWNALLQIPFGTTKSYQAQADSLNRSLSIRAVAGANARNRIAILIPCHRIVGSDGHLTGYGGGLWRKRWLLDHETKYSGKPVALSLFQ